jgi:hypothetical protein
MLASVWRHYNLRLGARLHLKRTCPQARAIIAGTIPLGETTPGCGAEDRNAHADSELEFSVRVRADFTVQANFFVLGCRPFHREFSW